ncbi:MAG TPA: hypothetical protein PLO65_02815 [Caulobacter sp.]|nr:hypothetical protein [Caulobacter sp.]
MGSPGLFIVVVIGLLAGAIGRALLGGRPSRFAGFSAGVAGAIVGVPAAGALGWPVTTLWALALAALGGAVVFLAAARLLDRR